MVATATPAPANRLSGAETTSISAAKLANGARIRKIIMESSGGNLYTVKILSKAVKRNLYGVKIKVRSFPGRGAAFLCRSAEPGSYRAPALVTAPALQRTTP